MKTIVENWIVKWNDHVQKWRILTPEPWLYCAPGGHNKTAIDHGGFDSQPEAERVCNKANRRRQRRAKFARFVCLFFQALGLFQRYDVSGNGYAGGRFWRYCRLSNAVRKFLIEEDEWRGVTLRDEVYQTTLMDRDNADTSRFPMPVRTLHENGLDSWDRDYKAVDRAMGSRQSEGMR